MRAWIHLCMYTCIEVDIRACILACWHVYLPTHHTTAVVSVCCPLTCHTCRSRFDTLRVLVAPVTNLHAYCMYACNQILVFTPHIHTTCLLPFSQVHAPVLKRSVALANTSVWTLSPARVSSLFHFFLAFSHWRTHICWQHYAGRFGRRVQENALSICWNQFCQSTWYIVCS